MKDVNYEAWVSLVGRVWKLLFVAKESVVGCKNVNRRWFRR